MYFQVQARPLSEHERRKRWWCPRVKCQPPLQHAAAWLGPEPPPPKEPPSPHLLLLLGPSGPWQPQGHLLPGSPHFLPALVASLPPASRGCLCAGGPARTSKPTLPGLLQAQMVTLLLRDRMACESPGHLKMCPVPKPAPWAPPLPQCPTSCQHHQDATSLGQTASRTQSPLRGLPSWGLWLSTCTEGSRQRHPCQGLQLPKVVRHEWARVEWGVHPLGDRLVGRSGQ